MNQSNNILFMRLWIYQNCIFIGDPASTKELPTSLTALHVHIEKTVKTVRKLLYPLASCQMKMSKSGKLLLIHLKIQK